MNYITNKTSTQRTATASAKLLCNETTFLAIKNNQLPKGSPFDICLSAGLLAAKQTPYLIPHCHPVFLDGLTIEFHLCDSTQGKSHFKKGEYGVWIKGFGKCVGRTGIEMEVITAVSVSAITFYDLLKPLGSKDLIISDIKLLEKTGGRSQQKPIDTELKKAVLLNLSSRPVDKITPIVVDFFAKYEIELVHNELIKDLSMLPKKINHWAEKEIPLLFTIGRTSANHELSKILVPLIETKTDGIVHAMYHHGYQRSPESIDSNLLAGFIKKSLLITLPGSSGGVSECLDAIFPSLFQPLLKRRK
jgi:cyclic pyranopterin monophosphate synthase